MSHEHHKSTAEEMRMAEVCLAEAEAILNVSPRVAAREAYLSMLHASHARIAATGKKVPGTHKGVNMVIGDIYRDTGFPAQSMLLENEGWKLAADYGRTAAATPNEAREALDKARAFLTRLKADIDPEDLEKGVDPEVIAVLEKKGAEISETLDKEDTDISREEALRIFGPTVVEKAADMFKADFGKTFFYEDADESTYMICMDRLGYLKRAENSLAGKATLKRPVPPPMRKVRLYGG
jgi:uncharacterized protein (UPF0332 family)